MNKFKSGNAMKKSPMDKCVLCGEERVVEFKLKI